MSAYADTSFLVSLYVLESNSDAAADQMKHATLPILLTSFSEVELANAFYLRLFRKELIASKAKAAYALLAKDIADGILESRPVASEVFSRAKQIARKHTPRLGTRTLDVLHVASALILRADTFYTFDRNQKKLARAEGLNTP